MIDDETYTKDRTVLGLCPWCSAYEHASAGEICTYIIPKGEADASTPPDLCPNCTEAEAEAAGCRLGYAVVCPHCLNEVTYQRTNGDPGFGNKQAAIDAWNAIAVQAAGKP